MHLHAYMCIFSINQFDIDCHIEAMVCIVNGYAYIYIYIYILTVCI